MAKFSETNMAFTVHALKPFNTVTTRKCNEGHTIGM